MTSEMADRAQKEMRANKRYRWLGEQPQGTRPQYSEQEFSLCSSHLAWKEGQTFCQRR